MGIRISTGAIESRHMIMQYKIATLCRVILWIPEKKSPVPLWIITRVAPPHHVLRDVMDGGSQTDLVQKCSFLERILQK